MELTVNNLFKKVYCINLDRRSDRWEKAIINFDKVGIKVERFSGIEPEKGNDKISKGELGILLSNLEIVSRAKEQNLENVVIFEDDIEFHDDFLNLFSTFINIVPEDWGMLYFGGNHIGGGNMITQNLLKMNGSYAIHSIVIRNTMFDFILEMLPKAQVPVDVYYAELHKKYNAYCFRPHLTWQRPDYSDIAEHDVDYDFLRR